MTKQKKCKQCKVEFTPSKPLQSVCSPKCAIDYAKASRTKKERKEHREAKIKAKTRGDWMRETQAAFNAYIRARDEMAGHPCISCSEYDRRSWDAGHYRARSVAPALRFNEENVHRQCVSCNQHKHGNLIEYRIGLIKRIGIDRVEWLESNHEPKHYSIEDLKEIKAKYSKLTKELKKKLDLNQ